MDSPVVLKQTHGPLKVKDGESYVLRGTIHGDCKIEPGGRLDHRGFISGTLTVKAGATVRVRGMSTWTRWEKAEDIEFEGYGHPETGWKDLPFVGPSGFTRLDAAWQTCVAGLEDAVTLASLEPYIEERGKEAAFDAFWAATAVIARSGRTDTQLWALLSAAVFHPIEGVRVDDLDLWSPHDCKKKLEWPNLGKHLTTTPELFRRLLEVRNCAGRSRAFDYYRAISPVLRAVLALEPEPSPNAVAAVEKFRTMLRQQSTEASAHPKPPVTKPQTLPRSKTTGNTGAKRLVTADSGGEFFRPTTSSPIKAEIDPVDSALHQLDQLIGMDEVKKVVRRIAAYVAIEKLRKLANLPETTNTRHFVLTGNPGTGKTTVVRLLGEIFAGHGLLEKSTVHEVRREHLVGTHYGDTEKKSNKQFRKALGGVLFIDEAHTLSPPDSSRRDFGYRAIEELVPFMENHRREVLVVVAGYPEEMEFFLNANPGLRGRFAQTIHFCDYEDSHILEIFRTMCAERGYETSDEVDAACLKLVGSARKRLGNQFHNGRFARQMLEMAIDGHHDRLHRQILEGRTFTETELGQLLVEDLPTAKEIVPTRVPAGVN